MDTRIFPSFGYSCVSKLRQVCALSAISFLRTKNYLPVQKYSQLGGIVWQRKSQSPDQGFFRVSLEKYFHSRCCAIEKQALIHGNLFCNDNIFSEISILGNVIIYVFPYYEMTGRGEKHKIYSMVFFFRTIAIFALFILRKC